MTVAADHIQEKSDRELAAMFAGEPARSNLLALYRWIDEIESVPARASEPAILAMRFAWHREAVSDLFAEPRKVRRHDAYEGLAGWLDSGADLKPSLLVGLIDGIEDGLAPESFANIEQLQDSMDRVHGTLLQLGAAAAACELPPAWQMPAARVCSRGSAYWVLVAHG